LGPLAKRRVQLGSHPRLRTQRGEERTQSRLASRRRLVCLARA
jgi:hypothetical protein